MERVTGVRPAASTDLRPCLPIPTGRDVPDITDDLPFPSPGRSPIDRSNPVDLSIVIPAHDEARRLPWALDRLAAWMTSLQIRVETIVVDDGSRDLTAAVAATHPCGCGVLRLPVNAGKGAAVRTGMLAARGRVVAFTDADLPYRMDALERAFALIETGRADVVYGARNLDGANTTVRRALHRSMASAVFRAVATILISRDMCDTQCGLKAFSRQAVHDIFPRVRTDGFAFDAEAILVARRLGLVAARVPVVLVSDAGSTVSVMREGPRMSRDILRAALRHARSAGPKSVVVPHHDVLRTADISSDRPRRAA